jgi:hypothetical protein
MFGIEVMEFGDYIFPTNIKLGFFFLSIIFLILIKLKPKTFFYFFFITFIITYTGILLHFFNHLDPILWICLVIIFCTLQSKQKTFYAYDLTTPELIFAFIFLIIGMTRLFAINFDGADFVFYATYPFAIAQNTHMPNQLFEGSLEYPNIVMPPLFHLQNTFLVHLFNFFGFYTFEVFYLTIGLFTIALIVAMLYFKKTLKIPLILLIAIIFLDGRLFGFVHLSRQMPLMIFTTLSLFYIYEKKYNYGAFFSTLSVLTKVEGIFNFLVLIIFSMPYMIFFTVPASIYILHNGRLAFQPFANNLNLILNTGLLKIFEKIIENQQLIPHLTAFLICVLTIYKRNFALFKIGILIFICNIIIFFFPNPRRYSSFLYPMQIIIISYAVNEILKRSKLWNKFINFKVFQEIRHIKAPKQT